VSTRRNAWPLVAQREIQVRLTDRNFLVSTGLTLLLVIGVFALQALFSGGPASYRVAVTDDDGAAVVAQAEEVLRASDEEATIRPVQVADEAAGEAAVEAGDADALLVRSGDGWTLSADGSPANNLRQAVADVVRTQALTANAEAAGTSVEELTRGAELTVTDLSGDDGEQAIIAFLVGVIFAALFYMSSVLFGMAIATSVVEEKQSRIVEILAAAIPVRQLLTGKVLGNTALALGQLVLFVAVGLVGLTFTDYTSFLPGMTGAVLWYVPFFVAGFLALACIWAAAGALASRVEDLQATTMPVTLFLAVIFLVSINLEGAVQQVASFLPVASTILMPMRILAGEAAWWEPAVALLVTLAFSALTVRVGARLYRRALLQTQGRVSLRAAWNARD
jgi:ABC-2 type transport system permease protein